MLMYYDLWTKWSKIEQYTGLSTARDSTVVIILNLYLNIFHNFFSEYIGDMFTGLLGNVRFKSYGT